MMSHRRLFFRASTHHDRRVTELFDFVWPTATALWNLRWQVAGYLATRPGCSTSELNGRFTAGSGIHGTNLQRACAEVTWENQKEQLARFLLPTVCAHYESWIDAVLGRLVSNPERHCKGLQFPSSAAEGVQHTLRVLGQKPAPEMRAAFYAPMAKHRKHAGAHLDSLLVCYRYFKELRNVCLHGAGVASPKLVAAHAAYAAESPATLGLKEVPAHAPPRCGDQVVLHLRGVVGLSDVVLRLIATLDRELLTIKGAEREFEERWVECHGRGAQTLKGNSTLRERQVARLVTKLGLPVPDAPLELGRFLQTRGLVG